MKRTKILQDGNCVTLTWENPLTDEIETTTYFTDRLRPGYVRIIDDAGRFPQICEKLCGSGTTLFCSQAALLGVIRREHKKRMRDIRLVLINN